MDHNHIVEFLSLFEKGKAWPIYDYLINSRHFTLGEIRFSNHNDKVFTPIATIRSKEWGYQISGVFIYKPKYKYVLFTYQGVKYEGYFGDEKHIQDVMMMLMGWDNISLWDHPIPLITHR